MGNVASCFFLQITLGGGFSEDDCLGAGAPSSGSLSSGDPRYYSPTPPTYLFSSFIWPDHLHPTLALGTPPRVVFLPPSPGGWVVRREVL